MTGSPATRSACTATPGAATTTSPGGGGADKLEGDGDSLLDHAAGGNDSLLGGGGNDVLIGDAESVTGHARCGADVLDGGPGDDLLYGDGNPTFSDFSHVARGADTFVITKGGGHDTIGDFQPGIDKVVLVGFTVAEVRTALGGQEAARVPLPAGAHHHADVGGTQLDLGYGDGVELAGVAHLDPSDVVIA